MKTKILDNGGKSFDRYTIIIGGHVYGSSENPFHPCGFGCYVGDWKGGKTRFLGRIIKYGHLPEQVKKYVKQLEKQYK